MTINIDNAFMDNKLKGYIEVEPSTLIVGSHFRYTTSIYQKEGRKCNYGVVTVANANGTFMVNSFGERKFADWVIDPLHKYKKFKFYIRPYLDITKPKPQYLPMFERKLCLHCGIAVDRHLVECTV